MPPQCLIEHRPVDVGSETAAEWARSLIQFASKEFADEEQMTVFAGDKLPHIIVTLDEKGVAQLSAPSTPPNPPYSTSNIDSQYPPRFRIPPTTLDGLSEQEAKKRAQQFAMGSLLYEVMTGKPVFGDLDEATVQQNFEKGVYPDDTMQFPLEIFVPILGYWSQEFAQEWMERVLRHQQQQQQEPPPNIPAAFLNHVKNNPITSGIAAVGLGTLLVATAVPAILGIVGFSAVGPVAGTAAAAWQSSIGIVQAGSFFAWCQGAAMGGAAAGAIVATQGTAAAVAGIAALSGVLSGAESERAKVLIWNLFLSSVRSVK